MLCKEYVFDFQNPKLLSKVHRGSSSTSLTSHSKNNLRLPGKHGLWTRHSEPFNKNKNKKIS